MTRPGVLLSLFVGASAVHMQSAPADADSAMFSNRVWRMLSNGTSVLSTVVDPQKCDSYSPMSTLLDQQSHVRQDKKRCLMGGSLLPIARLESGMPFTMVRYNDGEWYAMRDYDNEEGDWSCSGNIDGMPCSRKMIGTIRKALADRAVTRATLPLDTQYIVQSSLYWEGWDADLRSWGSKLQLYVPDTIHEYVRDHPALLERFTNAVNRYRVVMVGACILRRLCKKVHYSKFVEIPLHHDDGKAVDATIERVRKSLKRELEKTTETTVVLMSGSMMTKALGYRLFPHFQGKHFFIDVGSGFDVLFDSEDSARMPSWRGGSSQVKEWRGHYKNPSAQELSLLGQRTGEAAHGSLKDWVFGRHGGEECAAKCKYD